MTEILRPPSSRRRPAPRALPDASEIIGAGALQVHTGLDALAVFPEVMDAHQAARFLQVSTNLLYALADEGKVPGWRLGRLWRFSKRALEEKCGASPPFVMVGDR